MNVENRIYELENQMSEAYLILNSLKKYVDSSQELNASVSGLLKDTTETLNSFNERILELEDSTSKRIEINSFQNDINESNQRIFAELKEFISETNNSINFLYNAVDKLSN